VAASTPTEINHLSYQGKAIGLLAHDDLRVWSLVSFDRGWVSDVKQVNSQSAEAAQFWRQFRRFCLGEIHIDPAKLPRDPPPRAAAPTDERFKVVNAKGELDDTLGHLERYRVLWVRLRKAELEFNQRQQLVDWAAKNQRVLWLETDLAEEVGFRLVPAPEGVLSAGMQITKFMEGMPDGKPVRFALGPGKLVINQTLTDLKRLDITPLVADMANEARVWAACAVRPTWAGGAVIYRPHQFHETIGQQVEKYLLDWSLKRATTPVARAN
jgi:hypothetical protein